MQCGLLVHVVLMAVYCRHGVTEVQLNKLLQSKGFCSVRVRISSIHRSDTQWLGSFGRRADAAAAWRTCRSAGSILFDRRRWLDPNASEDRPLLLQVGLHTEPQGQTFHALYVPEQTA